MTSRRLALVGAYNTRPATPALTSASAIVGVGIVGIAIVGQANTGSTKDHRLINCFQVTEVDPASGTKRLYIVKRPGFVSSFTPAAGQLGAALHIWSGQGSKIMTAFGDTNSTLYDVDVSRGAITGRATGISETKINDTPTLVLSSSNNTGWLFQHGSVLAQMFDVDFPGNAGRMLAGTFAHIDGYALIMDSECRIYNSDINSLANWTGVYVTANSMPDKGVGLIRHRNHIIAFGKSHFDVFRNAGNPSGSPLSRIEELSKRIGCTSADGITTSGDVVYFAGTSGANIAIYSYDAGQVKKLSSPEIEMLFTMAGPSGVSLTTLAFYGRHFVVVSALTYTFAYCIEEEKWHEWSGTNLWWKAGGVATVDTLTNYSISRTSTAGKVFVVNPQLLAYLDNGSAYTATIQTAKTDQGTMRRKFWNAIQIVGDQETSTSTLSVQWSDDDYQTLSTARTVDLSAVRPMLTRCGSSRRRSFTLTHAANTPMRLEALEFPELVVGSN